VGTGALGSFFRGGGAVEALGVCEREIVCQYTKSDTEMCDAQPAEDPPQCKARHGEFQLTTPVLNFPKNDIISSSYPRQIANARARVVTALLARSSLDLQYVMADAVFVVYGQKCCLYKRRRRDRDAQEGWRRACSNVQCSMQS
jgi:hypothetical protein